MSELGGDVNITDLYLASHNFHDILKTLPPVKLAFNCVGGENLVNIARVVAENATIVTYGRMNYREPAQIPHDLLVYKQLQLKGFWVSKWFDTHSVEGEHSIIKVL